MYSVILTTVFVTLLYAGGIPILVWFAVAALGVTQFKADGVASSDLVLGYSEARDGQEVLAEHFPAGSGSPVRTTTQAKQTKSRKIVCPCFLMYSRAAWSPSPK